MIYAGIDEAGLGPVLGPLVVSAAAFRIAEDSQPGEPPTVDLWEHLNTCVARKPSRKSGGAIAIGDSKKLFNRKKDKGLTPLERGVLAMLSCRAGGDDAKGNSPASLAELLQAVAPETLAVAGEYPWYGPCDLPLPHHAGATDIMLAANSLKVGMRAAGVELPIMRATPVFVRQYNRLIAATRNKSTTTFDVTCRHILGLWQSLPDTNLHIAVDRQGGRMRYRELLQRLFGGCELKVLEESPDRSAYTISQGPRTANIEFLVGGESKSLPIALASMLSKYLRELFMTCFNRFWADKVEGISPTAGYYVDGKRFYGEIAGAMEHLNIPEDWVLRCR
ncbi:MAG: hypothetical protein K8S55_13345 [Phycisphaerae bacterium]|nr:hypothetical protein [Phycisphaerae bacterium]